MGVIIAKLGIPAYRLIPTCRLPSRDGFVDTKGPEMEAVFGGKLGMLMTLRIDNVLF